MPPLFIDTATDNVVVKIRLGEFGEVEVEVEARDEEAKKKLDLYKKHLGTGPKPVQLRGPYFEPEGLEALPAKMYHTLV